MSMLSSLFGRIMSGRSDAFSGTLGESIDRANVRALLPLDSALYITDRTRTGINEKVEWLWQHFGVVKEGGAGIARHTVGKGISLEMNTDDEDWDRDAEDDFESYALTPDRCDLSGRRTFYEAQTTGIEQRMFRGEFFSAKTENPDWENEPCFQIYDSEEIATPPNVSPGDTILDGVGLNKNSKAVRYWVRGLDGTFSAVDRARMIHWFSRAETGKIRFSPRTSVFMRVKRFSRSRLEGRERTGWDALDGLKMVTNGNGGKRQKKRATGLPHRAPWF